MRESFVPKQEGLDDQARQDLVNHSHPNGEPISVYGNSNIKGCPGWACGHWQPSHRAHHIASPEVELPDGTKKKKFNLELLIWFPWILDFFYNYHQTVVNKHGTVMPCVS